VHHHCEKSWWKDSFHITQNEWDSTFKAIQIF